jgi:hypothetical protein
MIFSASVSGRLWLKGITMCTVAPNSTQFTAYQVYDKTG